MTLLFLRHGIAVERGTPGYDRDCDRPLTEKGRGRMQQIAHAMRSLGLAVDAVLFSPYLRAKETAEIVARAFKAQARLRSCRELEPGGEPCEVLKRVAALNPKPESVLLVGHEPDLSRTISHLLTGGTGLSLELKKGGLCQITVSRPSRAGKAKLDWLLPPRVTRRVR